MPHPLYPPLQTQGMFAPVYFLFGEGEIIIEGLSPLSAGYSLLPRPAAGIFFPTRPAPGHFRLIPVKIPLSPPFSKRETDWIKALLYGLALSSSPFGKGRVREGFWSGEGKLRAKPWMVRVAWVGIGNTE